MYSSRKVNFRSRERNSNYRTAGGTRVSNTRNFPGSYKALKFALNWFFNGHRNKLTAEVSVIDFQTGVQEFENRTRLRIQWDISF